VTHVLEPGGCLGYGARCWRAGDRTDLYNGRMVRDMLCVLVSLGMTVAASGQTPQPFPRPNATPPPSTSRPAPEPPVPEAPVPQATPEAEPPPLSAAADAPTEAELGFAIYPTARFIASYDAGRAQRYYIFGTTASFADLVAYYQALLKERGNKVFDEPPTHMFEVGRFNDDTMAFPPGVTIKDWTWGGSSGYPNPLPGAEPARFASIIMIVPLPPAAPR